MAGRRPSGDLDAVEAGLPHARFGRNLRLRKSGDFRRVQRKGHRRRSRHLVVLWLPAERELPRFGLAVSRKVGNAVTRNRVKRWLREAIRKNRGALTYTDAVFIARSGAGAAGYSALAAEVVTHLEAMRTSPGVAP